MWPLLPDVHMVAELERGRDRIATLQVQVEQESDGRTLGRLRRELNKLEMVTAVLALKIEQASDAERDLWVALWGTPQAVIWEESHAHREVAQYVRWKVRAEQGDLRAATEARLLSDRLGLNPLALLRLRAEIEHVAAVEKRSADQRDREAGGGSRKAAPEDDPRGGLYVVS